MSYKDYNNIKKQKVADCEILNDELVTSFDIIDLHNLIEPKSIPSPHQ